jgi:hypothetical protein
MNLNLYGETSDEYYCISYDLHIEESDSLEYGCHQM